MINYKIENQRFDYRPLNGLQSQLDFLKEYGHHKGRLVGKVIAGVDTIDIGMGITGFQVMGDSVIIGPEWQEVFVLESYRGKGLGKLLTELAIEYASEISLQEGKRLTSAEALTRPNNTPMRMILEQLGFTLDEKTSSEKVAHYLKSV